MRINNLSTHFGIEINDFNLMDINSDNISVIKDLLLKNQILVIRDQKLSLDKYKEISVLLGDITFYPFSKGLPDHPEIVQIRKEKHQHKNFSEMWHTDSTYLDNPPDFTMLYAEVVPPIGGDTVFSNTVKAYNELSDAMKVVIDNLECINVSDLHSQDRTQHLATIQESKALSSIHPVVMKHSKTGVKSIYVNEEHTHSFNGMTRAESKGLIDYLTNFIKRSEFTLRVNWKPGTIAIWDNRTTQHHAVNDYHGHLRVMNRITLQDHS